MFDFFKNKNNEDHKNFDSNKLVEIELGGLEAENDQMLSEYFHWTSSSAEFFKNDCNYIVGTYGVGKSALFKAISSKKILEDNEELNDYFEKKNYIVSINDELKIEKLLSTDLDEAILFWSTKIVLILVRNILRDYKGNEHIKELNSYLSDYEELRQEFNIYKLKDHFSDISINPTFEYNGLKVSLELLKKGTNVEKKLNLNELYCIISNFLEKINKDCLLLIDRIDDYVRYQDLNTKNIYLQALHEVVEEVRKNIRIRPILFIREDLYKNLSFSVGYIKVKERSCFITWEQEEILFLVLKRLAKNEYIRKKIKAILDEKEGFNLKRKIKRRICRRKINFNSQAHGRISEMIYYFISPEIANEKKDFENYIKDELAHGTSKYNPRITLLFFKKLLKNQVTYNNNNTENNIIKSKEIGGYTTFNLFNKNSIIKAIKDVKEDSFENIVYSFIDKKFQEIFRDIYISQKSLTKENDYNAFLKGKGLKEEEIKFFKNQLLGLGYLKQNYQVYNLYKK